MATPPHTTRAEVDAAVARVLWRHRRVDDPRSSALGSEPRDVLEHLTRHSVGLPRWVAAQDALDALVLSVWLWWEDRRRERALLRRGLHLGLTLTELGTPLGITTAQGLRDRLDRLDALLEFDRPDEKLTRAARRAAAEHGPRQRWIDAHRDRVRDVLTVLLQQLDRLPDPVRGGHDTPAHTATDGTVRTATDGTTDSPVDTPAEDATAAGEADPMVEDWVSELRADLASDHLTPATLSMLGLVLGPLRIAANTAQLDPAHGIRRALRAADALRADFARAG